MFPASTAAVPAATALPFRSSNTQPQQHQQQQAVTSRKRQPTATRMTKSSQSARREPAGAKPYHHHNRPSSSSTSKTASSRSSLDEGGDFMAGTFLQFCATCENQITVADSTGLYCSEKCRSQDTSRSATRTYALFKTDASRQSPPSSPRGYNTPPTPTHNGYYHGDDGSRSPDIIPQRSPTQYLQSAANRHSISYNLAATSRASSTEDIESLLSPPALRSPGLSRSTPRVRLDEHEDGEAFRYLSQFHPTSYDPTRPRLSKHGQAPYMGTAPPSLSHTPSASSIAGTSYVSTPQAGSASVGASGSYFERRSVVPQRASTAFSSAKSIDLVTPLTEDYISSSQGGGAGSKDTLVPVLERRYENKMESGLDLQQGSGLSYEKRRMSGQNLSNSGGASSGASSRLRQMFEKDEMRGRKK